MFRSAGYLIYSAEIPDALITLAIGLSLTVTTAGVAMMAWLLTTVIRLAGLVSVLEERVGNLVHDIDALRAGNPEIRR
jgi:hypothetical protein